MIKKYVTLLCNFMLIILNTPGMFYWYRMKIPKYYHACPVKHYLPGYYCNILFPNEIG